MENKEMFLLEQNLDELRDIKDTIENLEFEVEEEEVMFDGGKGFGF